jgi:hypothetical protein
MKKGWRIGQKRGTELDLENFGRERMWEERGDEIRIQEKSEIETVKLEPCRCKREIANEDTKYTLARN